MAAKPQISEAGHPSTPPSDTEPTLFLTSFLLIFDSWVRSTSGMTKAETPHHLAHPYHHPSSLNHLLQPVTAPQINRDDQWRGFPIPAASITGLSCIHPFPNISLPILGLISPPQNNRCCCLETRALREHGKQDKLCADNFSICFTKFRRKYVLLNSTDENMFY